MERVREPARSAASVRVETRDGVAWVTIDHPPINLFDLPLMTEMTRAVDAIAADPGVRVAVFQSAHPEFFIAHADVSLIQQLPADVPPKSDRLSFFHAMVDRVRTMPKATIAKIAGIARGGGSEFALSCDMRFGALGKTVLAQPEVALGIIPGGSGTQRLPRLVGRARALEIILGCDDVPADLAERWGYLNRALPPAELDAFVDALARRIASFPAEAIALAKRAVDAADETVVAGLLEEAHAFNQSLAIPDARRRMSAFLAAGGQTAEVERELSDLLTRLR
jgi:enoyl-CoA hydratase/carnithine racemase